MSRHVFLDSGSPVDIGSVVLACRADDPAVSPGSARPEFTHRLFLAGMDRPLPITAADYGRVCSAIREEGKGDLAAEVARLSMGLRNLHELLRARLR